MLPTGRKISQKVLRSAPSTSHAYTGEGTLHRGYFHAHAYTATKNLKDFSSLRTRVSGATSVGSSGVAIQSFVN